MTEAAYAAFGSSHQPAPSIRNPGDDDLPTPGTPDGLIERMKLDYAVLSDVASRGGIKLE